MSTSSQVFSAAYEACLNEALKQSPLMIKRWYTRLADILYERSTAPVVVLEKQQLHDAWVALKNNQAAIESGFAIELTKAIAAGAKGSVDKKADKTARSLSTLRFDELELMGDAQVQETLDGARLQQVFLLASDSGLAGFSARISTAQGFKVVKTGKNPLRPEVFSEALLALLQDLPVDAAVRSRWLVFGAQLMGNELQALYVLLNDQLAGQGVQPAAYVVMASPDEPARKAAAADKAGDGLSAQPVRDPKGASDGLVRVSREQLLTLDHLHSLMVGDFDDSFSAGTDASAGASVFGSTDAGNRDFSHTVSAAMDVLAELGQTRQSVQARKKTRPAPPQPVALIREQLKTTAKSMGQSLAIEVVGLMIEQLVSDNRLLLPVRQVIANAEPAFLRLAVTDPRFFSDKSHPARLLLEAMTTKSLAYASEDSAGFDEFMQDLQEVADFLTEENVGDAQHFAVLLKAFEGRHAHHSQGSGESQNRAVQALLQAEQRNLLAEKMATEIRSRSDFVSGNRIITAFLTGPWAQVMAKERLLGEHGGIGSRKAVFSLALGDMLWSLNVAQASRHRKRLLAIIPDMLASVREGLLTIDYPLDQSKAYFDALMAVHQQALQPNPGQIGPALADARPKTRADLEKEFDDRDRAREDGRAVQPWLAPAEARQSGFMDFADENSKPRFEATVPQLPGDGGGHTGHVDGAAEPTADEPVDLKLGAWVELLAGTKWLRAQLTWISPHHTLFMFTSDGGRSHSMTTRMLQNMMARDCLKVISEQGVLDGALDSVARAAMRNSVQGRSAG